MPDIKAALYGFLTTQPSITALVGDRIYAGWASQRTPNPYIIISRIDSQDFAPSMAAASNNLNSTVQLDVWGDTSIEVEGIVEALRPLLDGFRGLMSAEFIYSMRMTSVFDGPLAPNDGSADATARTIMTLEAWHK